MTKYNNIYIKNIYYMLAYAFQELKHNNYENISGENFEDIYDLFAEILVRGISYQLKQGLHKEYIIRHDTLSKLKGKLNINGTIKNQMERKRLVDCNFDELSENNIFNQILKTTMMFLRNNNKVKSIRKHSLHNLILFFRNVETIDLKIVKWSLLRFDRNSRTYQMLLYICHFIMNGILFNTNPGKFKMHSFLDDNISRLYEKFVLEYYKKHFPHLNARAAQIEWNINENSSDTNALPIMQTDIMLTFASSKLIIDTKYYSNTMQENYGKHTIHSNNIYQIQSYIINEDKQHLGNVHGMLLYAKTDEEITPNSQITLNDGNIIFFRTLDLNRDFESIKKELDGLISNYEQTTTT